MSVPKLRFKADDGSEFPEWEEYMAEQLFDNIIVKNHSSETVLTIVQGKGTVPRTESGRNIQYDADYLSNYKYVQKDDFIIHLRSFEGGLEIANEDGIVSPAYIILRSKLGIAPSFYYAYFHTNSFINQNLSKAVEGIRDGRQISYAAFRKLKLPWCSLFEQKKIADFLTVLNHVIEQTQSEIAAWEKQKRGVMQLLFSQKVRFKADDGNNFPEWKEKNLGEVFSERIERSKGTEDLLAVTIAKGVTKQVDSNKRNMAANDTSNYKVVHRGDLAYNTMRMWQGAEGASAYDGIISPAYTVLICNKGHDVTFFEYMFKQTCMLHQFEKYSQGLTSDTWNLKYKNFSPIKVFVPTLLEQQKIASCLLAFDDVIDKTKKELDEYRELKKGLLQQMFV